MEDADAPDARLANLVTFDLDTSNLNTTNSNLHHQDEPKNGDLPVQADEGQNYFVDKAKRDTEELTETYFAAECSVQAECADDNFSTTAESLGFLDLNDNSKSQNHECSNQVSSEPATSNKIEEDEVECMDLSNIFSDHNYTSQEPEIEDDVQTEKLKIHISNFILNTSKDFAKIDCPALLNFVNTTIENITSFSVSEIKKEIKEEICDDAKSEEQTDLLMQSILDGLDASDNDEESKVNLQRNQQSTRIKREYTPENDNNSAIKREESTCGNTVRPHLNEAPMTENEVIKAEIDLPSNVDITTNSEQNEFEKDLPEFETDINKEIRTENDVPVNPDTISNEDIGNKSNIPAADNEILGDQELLPERNPLRNEYVSTNEKKVVETTDVPTNSITETHSESNLQRPEEGTVMRDQVTSNQNGLQNNEISKFYIEIVEQNNKEMNQEGQCSQVSMEVNYNSTESEHAIELQQDTVKDFGQSEAPSPSLHETCSEPLEHAFSDDYGGLLENRALLENSPPKLQKLISFAKSLYEDCSSFLSSSPSDCTVEKLETFISEHFLKFRSIADFSKNQVDKSIQTEPRLSSRKLKRLNSENKKALLQSSSSLGSSSDSSSESSYSSSVSSRAASIFSKSTNSISTGRKESRGATYVCDGEQNGNQSVLQSDSDDNPLISASQSPKTSNKKVDEGVSQSESDKENTGMVIKARKRTSPNSDLEDEEDREIERLINLNALEKRQNKGLALKSFETEKNKTQTDRHKSKATLIDFLENNNERDAASEDSFCESEEEIITETQYLARYNANLKQELINGSSTDSDESGISNDDLLESESDEEGNKPPPIEKFLKSFKFDDSDEEINEAHINETKPLVNKGKISENPDDMNQISPHDSDCDILSNNSLFRKQQRPKSLEKMLSEAEKRKKNHDKAEEDLISLSSESESSGIEAVDLEPEVKSRIIKPMLRQDQLASETRKAQKHEADRIRRLEKKQATLARVIKEYPEATEASELILDYIEQTKTFIKVHPGIVKHLKPHQIEGVRFMYDSCYGGVEALKKSSGSGCILAHCMGLGKTLQLIALLHTVISYKELNTSKILVLCPKSTVMNWADEILRWLGPLQAKNLKVSTFNDVSDINEKLNILREWSLSTQQKAGCLLLGYEAFRTLIFYHSYKNRGNLTAGQIEDIREKVDKYLLQPGADLVVCDEGHIIKNSKSAISLAVAKIITPKRIVLTGTPIQNNLKEYYSMVNFIKPLFLGTEKEFANLYANPIKNGQHKDSSKRDIKVMKQRSFVLHKKLSKFVQRKEAELLKTFLPAKYEYVLFVPMTTEQNNLYEHILEAITRREENRGRGLITDYTCLRKIWTHPKVLEDAWKNATSQKSKRDARKLHQIVHSDDDQPDDIYDSQTGVMSVTNDWWRHLVTEKDLESIFPSNKLRTMFEILRMCDEKEEKCLIFSAFVAVLNVVEYFFNKISNGRLDTQTELNIPLSKFKNRWINGQDYYRLDGKTPKTIRHEMIKRFNSPLNKRARVFLISAKAGGQGINLTGANRVIILDTSWNPSNDQQNIFRIFRLGQKRNCYIYRLLAMGTMEEKVYSRSVTKQAMSFRVVDEQQIDRHYNMAELAELYTLTKPNYGERPLPQFPQDSILASLLLNFPNLVYKFHEHDSLLENKVEQELSEQEKADAWAAYERDLQLSTEIRDLPVINDAHNNFAAAKMQNYFGPDMSLPSFLNYQNIGQQTGASPFMQSLFPHFNYQNTLPTHSYLEMINFYRKFAQPPPTGLPAQPTPLSFPDINKAMGENSFNSSSYVPTAQSASSNSALLSRLQPNISNSNPLSALGDLTAFGMGAPKTAHNNSTTTLPHHHPASLYASPGPSTPNPSMHLNATSLLSPFDSYKQSLETYNNLYDFNSNTPKPNLLMNNLPQIPYSSPQLNVQSNSKPKEQITSMESVRANTSEQNTVKNIQNEKSIPPELGSKRSETSNKTQNSRNVGTTLENAESNKDLAHLSAQVPHSHSENSTQKQNTIIQKAPKSLSSPSSTAPSSSRSINTPSSNGQSSRSQQSLSSSAQNISTLPGQSMKYVNTGQNPISIDSLSLSSGKVSKLLSTTDNAQETRTTNSLTCKSNNSPITLGQPSTCAKHAEKQSTATKEKHDSLAVKKKAAFNPRGNNEMITPNTSSLPSGNMGIVYPNKQRQISAGVDPPLIRNNEMQIIPTTSPPGTTSISKQFTKLSPSISVTAVQNSNVKNNSQIRKVVTSPNTVNINRNIMSIPSSANKNSRFIKKISPPVPSNELAKKSATGVLGKAPNLFPSNYRSISSASTTLTPAPSASSSSSLQQRSSTLITKHPIVKKNQHSFNTKIMPTSSSIVDVCSTSTATKTSNAANKIQSPFNSGKSYVTSSLSTQPPPTIARNGPKRAVGQYAPPVSGIRSTLNIRPADKQSPSGTGVYIIETNINEKKLAIGTPTKGGGGTTVTKVSVARKRKAPDVVCTEPKQAKK